MTPTNYEERCRVHRAQERRIKAAAGDMLAALMLAQVQLREYVDYHHARGGCSVDMETACEAVEAVIALTQDQQ